MIFISVDGTFSNIAAMDIWRDKLKIAVSLINNGAAILSASFIVKDLEIKPSILCWLLRDWNAETRMTLVST